MGAPPPCGAGGLVVTPLHQSKKWMTCDRICGNSDIFRNIDSHKFCLKSLDKHIMTRLKNSKTIPGRNVPNVKHWCIVSNQVFDVYNIAIVFQPFPTNGVGLRLTTMYCAYCLMPIDQFSCYSASLKVYGACRSIFRVYSRGYQSLSNFTQCVHIPMIIRWTDFAADSR